jgi:hypothetical protein
MESLARQRDSIADTRTAGVVGLAAVAVHALPKLAGEHLGLLGRFFFGDCAFFPRPLTTQGARRVATPSQRNSVMGLLVNPQG